MYKVHINLTYICAAFRPHFSLIIDFKICLRYRKSYERVVYLGPVNRGSPYSCEIMKLVRKIIIKRHILHFKIKAWKLVYGFMNIYWIYIHKYQYCLSQYLSWLRCNCSHHVIFVTKQVNLSGITLLLITVFSWLRCAPPCCPQVLQVDAAAFGS